MLIKAFLFELQLTVDDKKKKTNAKKGGAPFYLNQKSDLQNGFNSGNHIVYGKAEFFEQ